MKRTFLFGFIGVIGIGIAETSHAAPDVAASSVRVAAAETEQASTVSAAGVVQQIKPEQGRVKISHEPIPALEWPAMTMYFRVKDKALLEGIAVGDKVRFELEKGPTGLVIQRMEKIAK